MNTTKLDEDRIIIRDSYGSKLFEIFLEDRILSSYDYTLGQHLMEAEISKSVLEVIKRKREF